jgi:hypothetical protein
MNASSTRRGHKTAPATPPPATPPGTPGATPPDPAAPAAPPAGGAKEITLDEIQASITSAVLAAVKAALPEARQPEVTTESVKTIIAEVIAAQKLDAGRLTKESATALIGEVITKQMDAIRRDSKSIPGGSEPAEGGRQPGGVIEIPVSWSKGNLPLHGKQLMNLLLKRPMNEGVAEPMLAKGKSLGEGVINRYRQHAKMGKALTSTGTATGDEFVPTDLSGELQRRLYLSSNLMAALAGQEIDMPTQPYELPMSTTRPTFYLEATESTAGTESTPGTGKMTLDAKKFMGKVLFSYEVDEDSIIPILPWLQGELALAAAAALESVLINGDTTATHMDSDTHAISKAAEKAWKGFRKLSLAVSALKLDMSTGGISEANLRALKKLMKKYGMNLNDLMWIVGPMGGNDIGGISSVSTLEKFGPRATILTGEIGAILGIPIITSAAVREDLNASGVYDGSTTTKGSIQLVNKSRFMLGRRREFTVEVDKDIDTQQNKVVASFRKAFSPIETPSADVPACVVGYNYTA